jgi:hypothetical protein
VRVVEYGRLKGGGEERVVEDEDEETETRVLELGGGEPLMLGVLVVDC